ncbi:sigma-54-dependent transcriptional regulator [Mucilaginibacter pedocola]|uniref:Sigma-54-dependent Fis family transcriptional regulator n=1 Tax=Mucilaginibacter pedocola TaxID=1792845 RepID=A0A1S9PLE9_9SPHI|nr:sigma-54 dependent transcriptional regulator [Mucilaginibacter pedocola]OOQ61792.1 sigma-54-dependent Fis family transcriptional regulator [Mucilaginibacter pedocola]
MQQNILIIDDEKKLNGLLTRIIELEGYKVFQAYTGKEGLKLLAQEDVQVVISDVKLPDANGVELVKQIKEKKPYVEVINLTAFGTIADGVLAIKNGAFDYITKGDDNDKILPMLARAMDKAQLQRQVFNLQSKVVKRFTFEGIIGQSKPVKAAIDLAKKVSVTDTTVLLLGETGTGKEVFANAIHYNSRRNTANFVAVNCSSFSKELLESELFGHKAGAFTGALKDKKGLFEEADGGTMFLDEIGEMDINLQAKILRVIEQGEFIKIGDTKTSKVNVRIIAATNRKLEGEIAKGNFREDLFYRLSVFQINLPSLNERRDDIPLLAKYYLAEYTRKVGQKLDGMSPEFLAALEKHNWKGNIRELKNVIERSVIIADGPMLSTEQLPIDFYDAYDNSTPASFSLSSIEKHHIQKILHYTKGNKTETARLLGIGLTTLYRKIEEYEL